ncbi:MAG: type III pantothenate kinase [Phycisphaeraceae bacterium]|nr:MAG: type III pantothenate kinase [Phycisphaeraceae bacterium]
MRHDEPLSPAEPALAMAIGNTRTSMAVLRGTEVDDAVAVPNADLDAIVREASARIADSGATCVLASSVNHPHAEAIETRLLAERSTPFLRCGRDFDAPIVNALDDDSTVGQDRLLVALAGFDTAQQACVVIDAGSAITIDFVDGQGVFQGGIIAPGLAVMLASLHEHTASLPKLSPIAPDPERGPFGKDTAHAMLLGVRYAAIGLVRHAVERYAEAYEAYPQVIATGGDAELLFTNDPFVDHLVPHLQLKGLAVARQRLARLEDDDHG